MNAVKYASDVDCHVPILWLLSHLNPEQMEFHLISTFQKNDITQLKVSKKKEVRSTIKSKDVDGDVG